MNQNQSILSGRMVKFAVCLLVLLSSGPALYPQSAKVDSIYMLNDNRVFNQHRYTKNPAAIASGYQPDFGYAIAKAGLVSGNFKRPMESSSSSVYSLSTGGYKTINRLRFLADFRYQKIYDNSIDWAAVNDPYEGNPFIWADSSSGKWDRDHIDATIGMAATVVNKKLHVGLVMNYAIGTGARTSEPKPYYRMRDISLRPGVIWNLSSSEELGITGEIEFVQEENEIGYYSNSNVLLYRLRGYGTFSKSPFVSGERKRRGIQWKGSLHYGKEWKKYGLLVSATASQRDEEVFEGIAKTSTIGYFTGINFNGSIRLFTGNDLKGKALDIIYENKNGYADDMLFRAESASFIQHLLQAKLSVWKQGKKTGDLIQWNISPSLCYNDYVDQATYMQFAATTVGGTIELNYRKKLTKRTRLTFHPTAGYFTVVDNYFTVRNQQVVIQELIIPDYSYFSADFWKAGCQLSLEIQSERTHQSHFITLSGNLRMSNNKDLSSRTFCQLQYSILF